MSLRRISYCVWYVLRKGRRIGDLFFATLFEYPPEPVLGLDIFSKRVHAKLQDGNHKVRTLLRQSFSLSFFAS